MRGLTRIAEHIILEKVLSGGVTFHSQNKFKQAFLTLAGIFALLSLGFFIYASHLYLQTQYPPEEAAFYTSLIALSISLLMFAGALTVMYYKQRVLKHIRSEVSSLLHSLIDFIEEEFKEPVQENPKTSVTVASIAGYMAGQKLF
jgi:hypothetical protein